ncbi:MAG: hypothetical protein ACI87E_003748 [Mariniblastus sp.]|jgi:hypothetical protein
MGVQQATIYKLFLKLQTVDSNRGVTDLLP